MFAKSTDDKIPALENFDIKLRISKMGLLTKLLSVYLEPRDSEV